MKKPLRVLHLADRLYQNGGIETRLTQYLSDSTSIQSYVMAKNKHAFIPSKIRTYAPTTNVIDKLSIVFLLFFHRIQLIDVHSAENWVVDFILSVRKRLNIKVILTVHGDYLKDRTYRMPWDYVILISNRLKNNVLHKFRNKNIPWAVIPNAIQLAYPISEPRTVHDYAILISRLEEDKYASIASFIALCKHIGIHFKIAGSTDKKSFIDTIQQDFNLNDTHFLGYVNTQELLSKNKFLFVAGLGLTAIEALTYYNKLCIPSSVAYQHTVFVNDSNVSRLFDDNFTVKDPQAHDNEESLLERYQNATYLSPHHMALFNFEMRYNNYLQVLHDCMVGNSSTLRRTARDNDLAL